MLSLLRYIKNIGFRKKNSLAKRKMFLGEPKSQKKTEKTYKKRKNIHFQTKLNIKGQTKILFYTYISIALLLISGVIFLIASNNFTVKNIEIVRQDNMSNINLAYNAVNSFRGKSIFRVDKTQIIERIYSYQNNINSVTISSSLPDTLIIYIGSAQQMFNTSIDNKSYIITANGAVVPEKPNTELKDLSIILRTSLSGVIDYKQILKPNDITSIYNIIEQLEKNIIDIQIPSVSYLPTEREAHIKLDNETILIFDIDAEINTQIEKIAIFHNEHSPITQPNHTYIDLRVDKKIFFCSNDTKGVCEQNLKDIYSP